MVLLAWLVVVLVVTLFGVVFYLDRQIDRRNWQIAHLFKENRELRKKMGELSGLN
jgi:Tfp pilus assembly protein PilN